jgi:hypothetical protein
MFSAAMPTRTTGPAFGRANCRVRRPRSPAKFGIDRGDLSCFAERLKQISERQLIDWAAMMIINDAFYWAPEDADVVAEWVDRISLDLIPED